MPALRPCKYSTNYQFFCVLAGSVSKHMRVCIVNEFFYPDETGGTGMVLSELTSALRRDYPSVQIDVITSVNLYRDQNAQLDTYEEWEGTRIFRLQTPQAGFRSTRHRLASNAKFGMAALRKLLSLGRYDLVLIGTAPPTLAMAASAYKKLTGTPYLYVVYDLDPDRAVQMGVLPARSPITALLRCWQKTWMHQAAQVVVLGRCMQEYVTRQYGLSDAQVQVIPIGGDHEAIQPLSPQTRFREAQGLDGFVVCYSGNFGRYHDFDTILDAAKCLLGTEPTAKFVLVGGGAQKAHIEQRVRDEDIINVRVLPFVSKKDYSDLLASADVSLVTLEPGMEGLCVPSKFYSILASGRPTVATVSEQSEVARVLAEEGCGLQMVQGDIVGLVGALTFLLHHPEEARRMGYNARRALEEKYTNRHVAAFYHQAMCRATEKESSTAKPFFSPAARVPARSVFHFASPGDGEKSTSPTAATARLE